MSKKKVTKEFVKYEFNEEELKEISSDLARCISNKARFEDEKKSAMTQMNADIENSKTKINAMAEKIQSGWDMRYMDCYVEKDYKAKKVSYTRVDNGECVKVRAMHPDEFQMMLDEQAQENKKKKADKKTDKEKAQEPEENKSE